jgi:hypothetical protein
MSCCADPQWCPQWTAHFWVALWEPSWYIRAFSTKNFSKTCLHRVFWGTLGGPSSARQYCLFEFFRISKIELGQTMRFSEDLGKWIVGQTGCASMSALVVFIFNSMSSNYEMHIFDFIRKLQNYMVQILTLTNWPEVKSIPDPRNM